MKLDFFSAAPRPLNEADRQAEVDRLDVDSIEDPRFGPILAEVRTLLDAPMATISIIDGDRQIFIGRDQVEIRETPRAAAICAHVVDGDPRVRTFEDLEADRRFRFNPLVAGPLGLKSYVGAPLVTEGGVALGALCGLNTRARPSLSPEAAERMEALARQVVAILAEHRRAS